MQREDADLVLRKHKGLSKGLEVNNQYNSEESVSYDDIKIED